MAVNLELQLTARYDSDIQPQISGMIAIEFLSTFGYPYLH